MTTAEFQDEDGEYDKSALEIETSSYQPEHYRRRPWWKSTVGIVLLLAVIVAILVGLSFSRPKSTSSSSLTVSEPSSSVSSELSMPPQQLQEGEKLSTSPPQQPGTLSSSSPTTFPAPTTKAPTSSPTGSLSPSAAPTETCVQQHFDECHSDRMGHETPLLIGHAMCNHHYQFGITKRGNFQWYDCNQNITRVIYKNSTISYFSMSQNGVFQLFDQNNQTIWQKEPKLDITVYKSCLHKPLLDCPYLHLHRDGVLVLNSVDSKTGWHDSNAEKIFDNFFQS